MCNHFENTKTHFITMLIDDEKSNINIKKIYLKKNDLFYSSNTKEEISLITKGYLGEYAILPNGKKIILNIIDDFVDLVESFTEINSNSSYFALGETTIIKIPKKIFLEKTTTLEYQYNLIFLLQSNARITKYKFSHISYMPKKQRTYLTLLVLGEAFGKPKENNIILPSFLTHQITSEICNLTREDTSKQIKFLNDANLINTRSKPWQVPNLKWIY